MAARHTDVFRCLYADVSSGCTATSTPEHVIPAGLGGAEVFEWLICDGCNRHLGNEVDRQLVDLLSPVVNELAPFLGRRIRRRTWDARGTNGLNVEVAPGRRVQLNAVQPVQMPNGVRAVVGPVEQSDEMLRLAAEQFPAGHSRVRQMTGNEEFLPSELEEDRRVNYRLAQRAMAKLCLEVLHAWGPNGAVLACSPALRGLRSLVRNGPGGVRGGLPLAALDDEIAGAFSPGADKLTMTRVLLVHAPAEFEILCLLQVAGVLPFLFRHPAQLPAPAFSVKIEQPLARGQMPRVVPVSTALLSPSQAKLAQFVLTSTTTLEFATLKLLQSVERQANAAGWLALTTAHAVALYLDEELAGLDCSHSDLVEAAMRLLRGRFSGMNVQPEYWEAVQRRWLQMGTPPEREHRLTLVSGLVVDAAKVAATQFGVPSAIRTDSIQVGQGRSQQ